MNINYHYYTIKTLASYAGFGEQDAQFISHFSQQIDDFIMGSPFIVSKEPPDFFLKNNLAQKLSKDKWVFLPCPTGVNIAASPSHGFQLHTLMPFHFIMPVAHNELSRNPDRSLYRCVTENEKDSLLINRLMEQRLESIDINDKTSLMALGMLIHSFADTYAHCGFSGFHGWENETYVSSMKHKLSVKEAKQSEKKTKEAKDESLFVSSDPYDSMSPLEIAFFRKLISIGHGNVAHAPDYCDCFISLHGKKTKNGKMEPYIERDNGKYFSACSRRILDILCKANKKPLFNDSKWETLNQRLLNAQNVRQQENDKINKKKWAEVFPEITYGYKKNEFINVKLELLYHDSKVTGSLKIEVNDLIDIYSEQGDQARSASLVLARNVNDFFYTYNELAYRHVFNAAGEYASLGNIARLSVYKNLASGVRI